MSRMYSRAEFDCLQCFSYKAADCVSCKTCCRILMTFVKFLCSLVFPFILLRSFFLTYHKFSATGGTPRKYVLEINQFKLVVTFPCLVFCGVNVNSVGPALIINFHTSNASLLVWAMKTEWWYTRKTVWYRLNFQYAWLSIMPFVSLGHKKRTQKSYICQ